MLVFFAVVLLIAGSFQNPVFFILPLAYLLSLSAAYFIGAKINDYGINAAYSWSVKWAMFVLFLYLVATYMQTVFISAMIFFIFINTTLNPMIFVKREATT